MEVISNLDYNKNFNQSIVRTSWFKEEQARPILIGLRTNRWLSRIRWAPSRRGRVSLINQYKAWQPTATISPSRTWTLPSLIWTRSYPTNGQLLIREATRKWEDWLEENRHHSPTLQTPWETPQSEVVLEEETSWTPAVEDSRTDFKTDLQTSKLPTITVASAVVKMRRQVLLVREKVLRSLHPK